MKQILKHTAAALTLVAFTMALVTTVPKAMSADQFGVDTAGSISSVVKMRATTNTGAILLNAGETNFVTAGSARFLPVPRDNKLGFFFQTLSTNAAASTNCMCIVEGITFDLSGRTNVVDNFVMNLQVYSTGSAVYDTVTNLPTALSTIPSFAGLDALRLRSCYNSNWQAVWLTNAIYLRP